MRILVLGYIIRCPLGGMAWHYLQYVLGLRSLGHDVYFLEDSEDYPCCYDPSRHVTDTNPEYGLRFAARTFDKLGLGDRWAYHDAHASCWRGPLAASVSELCRTADLLLNISGANPLRPWLLDVPVRVFVDTDPVFEQIRQVTVQGRRLRADLHNKFFSFGENIETGLADVPSDGRLWKATRQPVALDAWSVTEGDSTAPFTTVLQWESYPARQVSGRRYGQKSDSFAELMELPNLVSSTIELAIGSPFAPREELREKGWVIRDPLSATRDPWSYQAYIRESKAEFGAAKHGYVQGWSGWFSERSAAYLASGRPVVAQDTGFSEWLTVEGGVLPFRSLEDAVTCVEAVNADYQYHCAAAREVAEKYFDARIVLRNLLEQALGDR